MGRQRTGEQGSEVTASRLLQITERHGPDFLSLLRMLVGIDSGSYDHDGVRKMCDAVELAATGEGFVCERRPAGPLEVLVARRSAAAPLAGPRILLLAHMDTVFEKGEAAERPFRTDGTTAHGPGVADDKCGVVAALIAGRVLEEVGSTADVTLVFTPDEEIGSPHSGDVVRALAREADVGLCLEAARADGSLVSARKGGDLRIDITGRAAHSGVEPEKGIHAALQMAHAVIGLQALNDLDRGITVNAGVATSGTRTNIVPSRAMIRSDVRAWTVDDFEAALDAAERVVTEPHVQGIEVTVVREFVAPPMEATPANVALADLAVSLAAKLGIATRHGATGGIGDANTMAAAGLPVLDGLAPVGGDDHAPSEWLDTTSIVPRVALLAALCDRLSTSGLPDEGSGPRLRGSAVQR